MIPAHTSYLLSCLGLIIGLQSCTVDVPTPSPSSNDAYRRTASDSVDSSNDDSDSRTAIDSAWRDDAGCLPPCTIDAQRCVEDTLERCAESADGCLEWQVEQECEPEEQCQSGGCMPRCPEICELGSKRCRTSFDIQVCEIEDGCPVWVDSITCEGDTSCQPDGSCGYCTREEEHIEACTTCGERERRCVDGTWSEWTACPPGCTPDTTQSCGACGTQTCSAQCEWGACMNEGMCTPGETRECGQCGTQRCNNNCQWSTCESEGICTPGDTDTCGNCGTRTCTNACTWSNCNDQGVCSPGTTDTCGNCGTRTCANDCTWSDCGNQGVCSPGETDSCGECGERTCSASCQWPRECLGDGSRFQRCNTCGWQFCAPTSGNWNNCQRPPDGRYNDSCPQRFICLPNGGCDGPL